MSGAWIHIIKTPQQRNKKADAVISDDKSNKKIPTQHHGIKKLGVSLDAKQNRVALKNDKITGLVVKFRDRYQWKKVRAGETRNSSANELLMEEAFLKREKIKLQDDSDKNGDISNNGLLSRQVQPENAEDFLSDLTEVSNTENQENQTTVLADNSGDASNSLNTNQSSIFYYPAPLPPRGRYAEYSGKSNRYETTYFRNRTSSIFDHLRQSFRSREAGPKSLLKINAACLIGIIIAILLMSMFLVLK